MKRYTWKPDVPDFRDHKFTATATALPDKVDLRDKCSPVEDQGNLGSCTGNAIVGALEYLENLNNTKFVNLSRLYVYYQERVIENTVNEDAGGMIRNGVKACNKVGVCTEMLWPYKVRRYKTAPSAAADADAANRKISQYMRITNINGLKSSLAAGFPVVFGLAIYESFEGDGVAKHGIVSMPTTTERMLGGHAVLAVGYDHAAKVVICRNSWGSSWGDKGYFYLPYGYITTLDLSDDFWTIRK